MDLKEFAKRAFLANPGFLTKAWHGLSGAGVRHAEGRVAKATARVAEKTKNGNYISLGKANAKQQSAVRGLEQAKDWQRKTRIGAGVLGGTGLAGYMAGSSGNNS